jgi:hypothetical protein
MIRTKAWRGKKEELVGEEIVILLRTCTARV